MTSSFESPRTTHTAVSGGSELARIAEGGSVYESFRNDVLGGNRKFDIIGGAKDFSRSDDVDVQELLIDLSSYPKSLSSKVKGELLRRIGIAVKKLGANVNMKSADTIIESVKRYLPDPDEKGNTIKGDSKKLVQIATAIAKVINETFGSYKGVDVIDLNQDKRYLVRDVATHIYGLACGVNIEWYKVYAIMKDTLKKMEALIVILQNYYGRNSGKIDKIVNKTDDPEVEILFGELSTVNAQLLEHIKEFVERMRAATAVMATDENKIVLELDKHRKKFDQLTLHYDADFDPADEQFGETLARLLSTLDNTAVLTHVVENSLKKVGITLSQYKHFEKTQDLLNTVVNKIEKMNPSRDAKKIGDILVHTEELMKLFGRRKNIKGGGLGESMNGDGDSFGGSIHSELSPIGGDDHDFDEEHSVAGGARRTKTPEQIAMDARVRRAELAVRAYAKELNQYINTFSTAVDAAAKDLANSEYDTIKLEEAIENINVVEELRKPRMYLALAGYYVDDTYKLYAKQYKDKMLRIVKVFKEMGSKLPAARKPLDTAGSAVMSILKKVDFFTDLLQTLLRNINKGDLMQVIADVPISTANVSQAVAKLYHSLHVSQMRKMIMSSCNEIDNLTDRYDELLAYSVGMRRRDIDNERNVLLASGDDKYMNTLTLPSQTDDLKALKKNSVDYLWRNLYKTQKYWTNDRDTYINSVQGGAGNLYFNVLKQTKGINQGAAPGAAGAPGAGLDENYIPVPNQTGTGNDGSGMIPTGVDGIAPNQHLWRARNIATHLTCAADELDTRKNNANMGNNLKHTSILTQTLCDKFNDVNSNYDEKHLEPFKREINEEFKAKQRLYKALESLDIILSTFTKELCNDIDIMKDVKKFLDDTKVYTRWFTDYTGDMLSAVFESMPSYVDLNKCDVVDGIWDKWDKDDPSRYLDPRNPDAATGNYPSHEYGAKNMQAAPNNRLWANMNPATTGPAGAPVKGQQNPQYTKQTQFIPHQIIAGDNVDDPRKVWNPKNVAMYGSTTDKFDPTLGTMFGEPAYSGIAEKLRSPASNSYYYKYILDKVQEDKYILAYGKSTGVVDMEHAKEVRRSINDFYDNFQALKNLFHAFITVYNRIVSKNSRAQAVMSPSQIYYSILSYLKQSCLARKNHRAMAADFDKLEHGIVSGTPQRSTYITKLAGLIMPAYYPSTEHCKNYSGCLFDAYQPAPIAPNTPGAQGWRTYGDYGTGNTEGVFVLGGTGDLQGTKQDGDLGMKNSPPFGKMAYKDARSNKNVNPVYNYPRAFADGDGDIGKQPFLMRRLYSIPDPASGKYDDVTFGTYRRDAKKHFSSVYELEDRLCAMGIKSIVSSVLSCMGLFYVSQQPVNMGVMYNTRSIVGGALRSANPFFDLATNEPAKVSEGALESYFYITRLAEFYRILFSRQARTQPKSTDPMSSGDCNIRYPMDLNGNFGKIMYIVTESGGNYSEEDVKILIAEINKAYYQYKSTNKVIEAFVAEVNRRYSCLVDDEAQKKLYLLTDRLQQVPDDLIADPLGTVNRVTGSLDFDDEDSIDKKNIALDTLATPSDALGKTLNKYVNSSNQDDLFANVDDRYLGRTRAEAKYKLDDKMKLYIKLRNLRATMDSMFDEYLKTDDGKGHYRGSTDKYQRTYYHRYLERERNRFAKEGKNQYDQYQIVRDLILNKEKAQDVQTDVTADTLVAFSETGLTMLDSVSKTRVLINALVNDLAIWSGPVFYDTYKNEKLKCEGDNIINWALNNASRIWYRNILYYIVTGEKLPQDQLGQGKANPPPALAGGLDYDPKNPEQRARAMEVGWYGGNPPAQPGVGANYAGNQPKLCDLFGDDDDDMEKGKGIYNMEKVMTLYCMLFTTILGKLGGMRLLGLGVDYRLDVNGGTGRADGGIAVMKDSMLACFLCNCDYVPHVIAYRKLRSNLGFDSSRDTLGKKNRRAQFIAIVYEEIIKRFELSPVFATMIGTCSRLSAAMGNLVTVTISSQGTHVDMSQLQNMLVDCLSYVKQYVQQFYDVIPKSLRDSLLSKDDQASIYWNEAEFGKLFETHISGGVKYAPILEVTNQSISHLHVAMINDYDTIYKSCRTRDDERQIVKYTTDVEKLYGGAQGIPCPLSAALIRNNYGGNAIVSALVPSHSVPTSIDPNTVSHPHESSLFRFFVGSREVLPKDQGFGPQPPPILGALGRDGKESTTLFMLDDYSSCKHMDALLPALNYGIKNMIEAFFDIGTQKIYGGIVEGLMGTKLRLNIENLATSYPDIFNGAPTHANGEEGFLVATGKDRFTGRYVNYAMPHHDALLTTSNAVVLREIYQSVNPRTQAPSYTFAALSDIRPESSMRESFKLKLPMFREYFLRIINKCKIMRAFLTKGCGSRANKKHMIRVMCPWARLIGGPITQTSTINLDNLDLPAGSGYDGETPLDVRIDLYGMEVTRVNGPMITISNKNFKDLDGANNNAPHLRNRLITVCAALPAAGGLPAGTTYDNLDAILNRLMEQVGGANATVASVGAAAGVVGGPLAIQFNPTLNGKPLQQLSLIYEFIEGVRAIWGAVGAIVNDDFTNLLNKYEQVVASGANRRLLSELEPVVGRGTISDLEFYRKSDEELYAYFMDIISNVEDISYEIASMCDNVHKEFIDDDRFMEFDERYSHNNDSYTPLSILTCFTSPARQFNELHSLETRVGTIPFKIQCGARGVLYSDSNKIINDKYLEGPIRVMKDANSGSKVHVDIGKYGQFAKRLVDLIRFNFSLIDYSELSVVPDGDYRSIDFRGGDYVDRPLIAGGASVTDQQIAFLQRFNHIPNLNGIVPKEQSLVFLQYDSVRKMLKDPSKLWSYNAGYYTGSPHVSCYDDKYSPYTPLKIQSRWPQFNPQGFWIIEWFINLILGHQDRGLPIDTDTLYQKVREAMTTIGYLSRFGPAVPNNNVTPFSVMLVPQLVGYTKLLHKLINCDNWFKNKKLRQLVENELAPTVFELFTRAKAREIEGNPAKGPGKFWGGIKTLEAGNINGYSLASIAGPEDNDEIGEILNAISSKADSGRQPGGNLTIGKANYPVQNTIYHRDGVKWRYVYSNAISNDELKKIVNRMNRYADGITAAVNVACGGPPANIKALHVNAAAAAVPNDPIYNFVIKSDLDNVGQNTPGVAPVVEYCSSIGSMTNKINEIACFEGSNLKTTLNILTQNLVTELGIIPTSGLTAAGGAGVPIYENSNAYIAETNLNLLQIANLLLLRDYIINEKALYGYYNIQKYYNDTHNAKNPNVKENPFYLDILSPLVGNRMDGLFKAPANNPTYTGYGYAKTKGPPDYTGFVNQPLNGGVDTNMNVRSPCGQDQCIRGTPISYTLVPAPTGVFYGQYGAKLFDNRVPQSNVGLPTFTTGAGLLGDTNALNKLKDHAKNRGFEEPKLTVTKPNPAVIEDPTDPSASWRYQANPYGKGPFNSTSANYYPNNNQNVQDFMNVVSGGGDCTGCGCGDAFSSILGGAINFDHKYSLIKTLSDSVDYIPQLYTSGTTFGLAQIMEMIDGDSPNELKQFVVQGLHKIKDPTCNRGNDYKSDAEQIKNLVQMLIELNLNPINVHSMQRFIPFANIYNYSYTLDRFVYSTYNVRTSWNELNYPDHKAPITPYNQSSYLDTGYVSQRIITAENFGSNRMDPINVVENTKVAFIKLLMDPYAEVDPRQYGTPATGNMENILSAPIGQILRGYDHLGMGVPKFLSDQVLGKALLGSMYVGGRTHPMGVGNVYDSASSPYTFQYPMKTNTIAYGRTIEDPGPIDGKYNISGGALPMYDEPVRTVGPGFDDMNDRNDITGSRVWGVPATRHGIKGPYEGDYGEESYFSATDVELLRYLSFYDTEQKRVRTYDLFDSFRPKKQVSSPDENQFETLEALREFHYEGYERFNTQLIRNVVFISNLQRFMRYTINSWLSRAYNLVERGHRAVAAEITERRPGNELPEGPDETYGGRVASWL